MIRGYKYLLIAVIAVAAVLTTCNHPKDDDEIVIHDDPECKITLMTNQITEIEFRMTGKTKCRIDWGDHSEIEEVEFSNLWEYHFQHRYIIDEPHVITISGDDVLSLTFFGEVFTGIDVSKDTALRSLTFYNTQIKNLDLSQNISLMILDCNNNRQLTGLDLSKNTALQELRCDYNRQFTELDVSNNVKLTILNCFNNELAELDVSKNTALKYLDCSFNLLTNIDVSANTELQQFHCHTNQLTQLDMSKNVKLNFLICGNNLLTELDMTNNTLIENIDCSYNRIEVAAFSALFESLPDNSLQEIKQSYITVNHNPGALTCQRAIAEKKGWWVYDGTGVVIPSVH